MENRIEKMGLPCFLLQPDGLMEEDTYDECAEVKEALCRLPKKRGRRTPVPHYMCFFNHVPQSLARRGMDIII